eukprot:m.472453 g.472453  ORF g.472453 m.472453 type:complete len:304 (-) comp32723_c0_seq1:47-958(-)
MDERHSVPALSQSELAAYLNRVNVSRKSLGPPSPTALQTLMHGHVSNIPFENVSVLLKEAVSLERTAVLKKIVEGRRGGCCFEQNLLMMAALRALEYNVEPVRGLMRLHLKDATAVSDRAHLLLRVDLGPDTGVWIVDVALGSLSMTAPVRTDTVMVGVSQRSPDGPRRVSRVGPPGGPVPPGRLPLLLEAQRAGATDADPWRPVYEFDLEGYFDPADMTRENAQASSFESDLATRLIVSRCGPSQARITLRNLQLTVKAATGAVLEDRTLEGALGIKEALHDRFGLDLTESDAQRLTRALVL